MMNEMGINVVESEEAEPEEAAAEEPREEPEDDIFIIGTQDGTPVGEASAAVKMQ